MFVTYPKLKNKIIFIFIYNCLIVQIFLLCIEMSGACKPPWKFCLRVIIAIKVCCNLPITNLRILVITKNVYCTFRLNFPLPGRDDNGRKVIYISTGGYDPKETNLADILKIGFMSTDVMLLEEPVQVWSFTFFKLVIRITQTFQFDVETHGGFIRGLNKKAIGFMAQLPPG